MSSNIYLPSKPRYEILDGLRGVGALAVILFHCFESYVPQLGVQYIHHGYLAVDFFFILSGFVIGYAYDDRWDRMTRGSFFKRRLIRLHPMVIAGTLTGACLFFLQECPTFGQILHCQWWQFALVLLMALFMIPVPPSMDIRGWQDTNPLNGANWSLTLEYIANILYAFVLRRLPLVLLGILCVASVFLTLDMTLGWDVFGFFPEPKYDLIGGWSVMPEHIYLGFTRLLYPFLSGLLISRLLAAGGGFSAFHSRWFSMKGGFWWCSLILMVLFWIPQIGGEACFGDGLYQALCILVAFPIVIMMGAGSQTTDARSTKLCKFMGDISYPLYITHQPFICVQMSWVEHHPLGTVPVWMHVVLNLGLVSISLFFAWSWLKLYDLPLREYLRRKLFSAR